MKKNYLLVTLGLLSALTLAACGSGNDTSALKNNNNTEQKTTETTEKETDPTSDESDTEDSEEDANEGEWEYQVGDMNEDGNFKLLARNDTSETIETASISLHFPQVTVAEVVSYPNRYGSIEFI
ncbi:hypothetical protein [Shouchella clausii]|uniref:hypothetical protein n=1 Tax=Shouchella clausii TaxID=79880 RepID=UPI00311F1D33